LSEKEGRGDRSGSQNGEVSVFTDRGKKRILPRCRGGRREGTRERREGDTEMKRKGIAVFAEKGKDGDTVDHATKEKR